MVLTIEEVNDLLGADRRGAKAGYLCHLCACTPFGTPLPDPEKP